MRQRAVRALLDDQAGWELGLMLTRAEREELLKKFDALEEAMWAYVNTEEWEDGWAEKHAAYTKARQEYIDFIKSKVS